MESQQINAMAVQAVAYSAYAAAVGIIVTTMGMALETEAHPDVIRDLRHAFGPQLVDRAIKNVGKENVNALAQEIDRLFKQDLHTRYGDYIATMALAAAPPGETRKVEEIASVLAGKGISVATPAVEKELATETAKKKAARKHPPKPLKDVQTGIIYPSMHKAYVAVAAEFGLDPKESWGIYGLMKDHPKRFKKVSVEEYKKYAGEQASRGRISQQWSFLGQFLIHSGVLPPSWSEIFGVRYLECGIWNKICGSRVR